jgi:hypothetical protein
VLRATVSPATATGTVRFRTSNGATLCTATIVSGAAHCSAPANLGAGTRKITAAYSGHFSASSASSTLVIARAATRLHATASRRAVRHAAVEVITARGLPAGATGTVTVTRPGHLLGHAMVRKGTARISFRANLRRGHYTLTVRYGGNGNYAGSVAILHITVTK